MDEEDIKYNEEDNDDIFEINGIKIEKNMDENLKKAITKYNLVHNKIVNDLNSK